MMSTESERWLQQLYEHLETVGEWNRGYGWQSFVSRKLQRSPCFVNQGLRRQNLQVSTLFSILEALGCEVPDFLAELSGASGQLDPLTRLLERGRQLQPELPQVVLDIKKRLDRLPELPSSELTPEDQALIDSIAEARYMDPHAAAATAEEALLNLLDSTKPRGLRSAIPLLAEWASARRRCEDPDSALWAFLHCLRWEQAIGENASKGDLLQRLAYCCSDHFADFTGALTLCERALVEHCMARNSKGAARVFVERGIWLFYLGRYTESLKSHEIALERLAVNDKRYLFGSFSNQALNFRAMGDEENLHATLQRAWALEPEGLYVAPLRWLEGTIAAEKGQFAEAESAFLDCCRLFDGNSSVNSALVSLELVHLYLEQGHTSKAYLLAKSMARFVSPLSRFPIAESAVSQLVIRATQCQLSEKLLVSTRKKIIQARMRA